MRKQPCKFRGFTIIEALCAGLILSMSAVLLGTAMTQSIRSQNMARDYQQAAELLDRVLTKIDLVGPARIYREGPTDGHFEIPHGRFSWRAQIEPKLDGSLYQVTVQIVWLDGREQREVEGQTLLNDEALSRAPGLEWDDL